MKFMAGKRPNHKKIIFSVSLVLLLIFIFYLIYLGGIKKDMTDFGVYYKGGKRILLDETLYRAEDGHLQFKYAPLSAIFFAGLAIFPYEIAKIIWYYLELILLFASFYFSCKLLPTQERGKAFLIGFGSAVLAKFIGREMELGQVNIFIIFILMLMVIALMKGKEVLAGVFWSFSLFFKPYAIIFLPFFLLKKRFKLIATGLIFLLVGLFMPILFYSFKGNLVVLKEWSSSLTKSTSALVSVYDNASLSAFLLKIFSPQNKKIAEISLAAIFLIMAFFFLGMMRTGKKLAVRKPEILEVSFIFVLIPLFSPLGWYYNYLYSLPAVILLLNYLKKFPPLPKYILIIDLVIIGGSLREVLGKSLFSFYTRNSLLVINYLFVLFFLFYSRLKRYA